MPARRHLRALLCDGAGAFGGLCDRLLRDIHIRNIAHPRRARRRNLAVMGVSGVFRGGMIDANTNATGATRAIGGCGAWVLVRVASEQLWRRGNAAPRVGSDVGADESNRAQVAVRGACDAVGRDLSPPARLQMGRDVPLGRERQWDWPICNASRTAQHGQIRDWQNRQTIFVSALLKSDRLMTTLKYLCRFGRNDKVEFDSLRQTVIFTLVSFT
jgi:hypothetical protein